MALIDVRRFHAFIAFETSGRADYEGQNFFSSALPFSHPGDARVARQRCPILRPGFLILSSILSFLLGHFYFGEIRTFLLWVDTFQ